MKRDFFDKEFDDGTLLKLRILRHYVIEWLPVFINEKNVFSKNIHIYDFFAGVGCDAKGTVGSPLVILEELQKYCWMLTRKKIFVHLLINEYKLKYYNRLKQNIFNSIHECRKRNSFACCKKCNIEDEIPFRVELVSQDFDDLFNSLYPTMVRNASYPRFMFLDQFGIKQITPEVFQKLTNLNRTDFLFFISSSYLRRFRDNHDFNSYLRINRKSFDTSKVEHCHRVILKYFNSLLVNKDYYLAPFSIKKGSNIYGLIFGSNSPLGMEKFLSVAWKFDKTTGEANFDIDHDERYNTNQLELFENKIKKLEIYEKDFLKWLQVEFRNNYDIYLFSLRNGFLPKHTNEILKRVENQLHIIGDPSRKKGAFYISYKNNKEIKIKYNE